MDEKTFKKIFKEALIYGVKRGLADEQSEDFAQRFILSRYIKRTDQKLHEAFIDFMRFEYGDVRRSKGLTSSIARKTSLEINDDLLGSYDFCLDSLSLKRLFEKSLSETDLFIIEMKIAGYTLKEIGNELNISYGRVHQRLKAIKAKILHLL